MKFDVGFKPKQLISESQKNEAWCKENVDWCIAMAPITYRSREDALYDRYNGKIPKEKFDHITRQFGIDFPAKIKHIPFARPLLNALQGDNEERPFDFIVRAEDEDSVMEKQGIIARDMLDNIVKYIKENGKEEELQKMAKYYKESYQTTFEKGIHYALLYMLHKYNFREKFDEMFVDTLITGKEYYRVVLNRIGEDPELEVIKSGELYFADNNVKWVKECDWAVRPMELSPTEIMDRFGDRMKAADMRKLEDWVEMYSKEAYKISDEGQMDELLDEQEVKENTVNNQRHKITVYFVEWKSIRRINILENENKYVEDAPFLKILSDEQVQELPGSRKKKIKYRYIQDRWEGVRIGDDIYVDLGKSKYVTRSAAHPSICYLSYNGLTFNGKIKPYSLIEETDDLQDLYSVMHFHKENLIALSGVKGMVMDLSQMPDFGLGDQKDSIKMWMYYKKLGVAFIDRSQEGADDKFNQFGTYDDTLNNSLGIVLQVIEHIERLGERITGVSRQRMGAITQRDGKANTETAITQSSTITEPIFNMHDSIVREALYDVLNACRIAWKDGKTGSFVGNDYIQRVFTLDNTFSLRDANIYLTNRVSEGRNLEELKMMAQNLAGAGLIEFDDVLPLFRKTSLKDVDQHIRNSLEKRRELLRQQEEKLAAAEGQKAMSEEQMERARLELEIEKLKSDIELNKRKADLEERELQLTSDFNDKKIANDNRRVDLEALQIESANAQANEVKNS